MWRLWSSVVVYFLAKILLLNRPLLLKQEAGYETVERVARKSHKNIGTNVNDAEDTVAEGQYMFKISNSVILYYWSFYEEM